MRWENSLFCISLIVFLFSGGCGPSSEMLYIHGGEFQMGRHVGEDYSDELPVHTVFVDSFYIGRYEITNRQYCDYLNSAYPGGIKVVGGIVYSSSDASNRYPYCDTSSFSSCSQIDYSHGVFSVRTKGGRDMSNDPVVMVSWYGAAAYCNWRSSEEGYAGCYNLSTWDCDFSKRGYRLPTEAEWEYAARGGNHSPYYRFPWGDTISHSQANYYSSSSYSYDTSPTVGFHPSYNDGIYPYTSPVGSFSANGYGLYDMTGNLWEWCNDWYGSTYYAVSPRDNPKGPPAGGLYHRILRGGCWSYPASFCRVAHRFNDDYCDCSPDTRARDYGFRIVLAD